jgi:hypothetical protein
MIPRIAYPILLLLSLVLLSVIGFGPSLHLISRQHPRRVSMAVLISPAVGLAIIALIAYPLFLNSIPLDRIVIPLTVASLLFSASLFIIDFRRHRGDYADLLSKTNAVYLAAFAVVFLLLILPAYVGGDHYRYWQGTPADARNYWSWTYFAQRIPFHNIDNIDALQEGIQHNPALIAAFASPPVRVVVEQPLAWLCLLFDVPAHEFYYYYKLLALVITFFGALVVAKQLNLPPAYRFGLIIALTVGFWPWYVSDIDALSHIYSIPLGLLFLFAWLQLEEDAPFVLFSRQRLLFSLSLAALLGYYPEFMPLAIFAFIPYHIKLLMDYPASSTIKRIPGVFVSIGIMLLLVLPTLNKMLQDLLNQSSFATAGTSSDLTSYFYSWLYTREMLTGRLWGLFYYSSQNPIILLGVTLLGITLGIVALTGLLRNFLEKHVSTKTLIVSSLFVSFWGGAFIIYIFGRDWVAGKAFAMGYPFALTALFVYAQQIFSNIRIHTVARYTVAVSLVMWSIAQFLVPAIRASNFAADQAFENYVPVQSPLGEIVPVIDYLRQNPPELLVSYFQQNPDSYFSPVTNIGWEMMLSDQFRHYTMRGFTSAYISGPIQYWQDIDEAPSHLLFDSEENYLQAFGVGTPIPVIDTPMRLYSVTPEELNRTIFRSNLLLDEHEQGFATNALRLLVDERGWYRAVEGREGHIRSLAGSNSPIGIFLTYSAEVPGSISARWNSSDLLESTPIEPGGIEQFGRCVSMNSGSNDLVIRYITDIDDPSVAPLKIYHFQIAPADNLLVDVGEVNDGMYISAGWNGQEVYEGTSVRWSTQTAGFTLFSCEQTDYMLRFRALALEGESNQRLTVIVNGAALDPIELEAGFNEYALEIPAALLNPDGVQSITFEHTYATMPPGDTRELAAMYDWIELAPRCHPVDVGEMNDGMNDSAGWYGQERYEGSSIRWATQVARLTLFSCEQTDYMLRFRALALEGESNQRLSVMVNNSALGPIELEAGFNEYEVAVPATLLNPDGVQSITFEHTYATMPPGDTRELAAMYDWIEFEPAE